MIYSKIIFDIVVNPDGINKKLNVRLISCEDQLHQLDSNNFAANVKSETLRILFAVVTEHILTMTLTILIQLLFILRSILMSKSGCNVTGLSDDNMPPFDEFKKALYGLLNASQYFEEFLSLELSRLGFVRLC